MITFDVQNLRGFDAPPPPPARGLIGLQEGSEQQHASAFDSGPERTDDMPSTFCALITQRQFRPTFEQLEPTQPGLIGIGVAPEQFGRIAFTFVLEDAGEKNEALALFRDLIEEASKGVDVDQAKHLRDVKDALDAERLPGNKLFR